MLKSKGRKKGQPWVYIVRAQVCACTESGEEEEVSEPLIVRTVPDTRGCQRLFCRSKRPRMPSEPRSPLRGQTPL